MSKRDRTTLGGLVLAMIVGVGGSLGLAASCLGRDRAHRADDDSISAFPEDRSARTSSGGVPGEEAVGQTEITSVELPAGAPAPTNTAPPAPENAPPPNPNPTPAPAITPRPIPVPSAAPSAQAAPTANANVTVNVAGDQVSTSTGDGGTSTTSAPAAPAEGARDGGAGNGAARDAAAAPATSAAPAATPTSPWLTEPPPYGASSWTSNHEAGAGPFTTERNVPDRPGP